MRPRRFVARKPTVKDRSVMSVAEDLLEAAAAAWLTAEGTPSVTPSRGAVPSTEPAGSGPTASGVREKASEGHSPSARALVNASDTIARMAASAAVEPPTTLRSRVLAGIQGAVPVPRRLTPVAIEIPAPAQLLGRLHAAQAAEVERRRRIEALHAAGGPGEEATDRALRVLIEQIAPYFGFEIVLVSAVVGDKTVHRVHRGFPAELGNMDVIPRELSFCTHTVSAREPFIVENTLAEAFFRGSVTVQQLGARAYLGVPLFSDGVALGSLCMISGRPQRVTPDDVTFLAGFARVAEALVVHDAGALAALIGAGATDVVPWVYTPAFLAQLVAAQAARAQADPEAQATSHVTLVGGSAVGALPASLIVGAGAADPAGDGRVVLVPARHPDAPGLISDLSGRGAAIRRL
jgi:hypothetical protein